MANPDQELRPVFYDFSYRGAAFTMLAFSGFGLLMAMERIWTLGTGSAEAHAVGLSSSVNLFAALCFLLKRRALGGHLAVVTLLVGIVGLSLAKPGHLEPMHFFPAVPVLATFFVGFRWAGFYALLVIASVLFLTEVDPSRWRLILSPTIATIFTLAFASLYESNRMRTEAELTELATLHPLTRLPSRMVFDVVFARVLDRVKRTEESFGVVFLDVDGLKTNNDRYGHKTGDALLVEVATRLKQVTRNDEAPFHLSGDEFVLLANRVDEDSMETIEARIRSIEVEPFTHEGNSIDIRVSLGSAIGTRDSSAPALLAEADAAMYENKRARGNSSRAEPT